MMIIRKIYTALLLCLNLLAYGQEARKWQIANFGLDATIYDVPISYTLQDIFDMTVDPSQIKAFAQNRVFDQIRYRCSPTSFYLRIQSSNLIFQRYKQEITLGLTFDTGREIILANLPIVNTYPFYTKDYMAYCLMGNGYLVNLAYGWSNNFLTNWLSWRGGLGTNVGLTFTDQIILFSDNQSIHENTYAAKKTYYTRAYIYFGLALRVWRGLEFTVRYQNSRDWELNYHKKTYNTQTIHIGLQYSLGHKKKK